MARVDTHQEELRRFFESGTKLSYKKGEIIMRPEDTPQGVFLLKRGFVKSYAITKYGEENMLVMRKSGQMFPIIWTFIDERIDVFYEAMSDVVAYRISREKYLEWVQKDANLAMAVLTQVVEMYRIHSERVINLEYRSAAERVAYRLITLVDRFGRKTPDGVIIEAPVRHFDIAASINCSRETASRELSKLEKKKYISSQDGQILVKDVRGLENKVQQKRRLDRFHLPGRK